MDPLSEVDNGEISEQTENYKYSLEDNKFPDMFPSKQGSYYDLPDAKISELMKLNSLQTASTQSLFNVVNKILNESNEKKLGDIPQRVASLLKVTVQEIEQRVQKQGETLKKQSSLYKTREEKYQSKIKALETLTLGTTEENDVVFNQLQQIKIEMAKIEEEKKLEEQKVIQLASEKDNFTLQISTLNQQLEITKKTYEENKGELEQKIINLEGFLTESKMKVKKIEEFTESKFLKWKKKEEEYIKFIDSQFGSLQELKMSSKLVKEEILSTKSIYAEEFNHFEKELKKLVDAAQNYHTVLGENRKLYNEVQDLKGNIRVYCRIRPILEGKSQGKSTIEYIGENGELIVVDPTKQGKDTHRSFKFSKVFDLTATQEEVYKDTQPLIRSVLDGYNVCIFAYGQTGSGKTYTMTGPSSDQGINYRALNDLFNTSQNRKNSISYEIHVQMVEIYNEQVRDLLTNDSSQKRLGILNTTQPNGLTVPDATTHPVNSVTDVLNLMKTGLTNRTIASTALNERSSRSHSVLNVHVRGTDLETKSELRGCLHLVDLAGSERVDQSKATGDRLKEAQHINKSLSALGDVIFALAQKNSHVPYRNSKLTQLLQSALGGQAKTLMFVQLNPDVESYNETVSTLKFAERVSGVLLGAAKSNKEGRGVRELMEQVSILKDTITKKDNEIKRLQNTNSDRRSIASASPRRHASVGPTSRQAISPSLKKKKQKASSDMETTSSVSEYSDKLSETGSHQSLDEFKHHKDFFRQSRLAVVDGGRRFSDGDGGNIPAVVVEDVELLGFGELDDEEERLSDISDGVLSMGTEKTDGSVTSIVEYTLFPKTEKVPNEKPNVLGKIPRPPQKQVAQTGTSRVPLTKSTSKVSSTKRASISSSSTVKSTKRWT